MESKDEVCERTKKGLGFHNITVERANQRIQRASFIVEIIKYYKPKLPSRRI